MSYYLFLDDERVPSAVNWVELPSVSWVIARNFNDFYLAINRKGIPVFVTYDHDLGPQAYQEGISKGFSSFDYSKITEKTGLDCAKFLIESCMDNNVSHPEFAVHSMNSVGKENIERLIISYNNSLKKV